MDLSGLQHVAAVVAVVGGLAALFVVSMLAGMTVWTVRGLRRGFRRARGQRLCRVASGRRIHPAALRTVASSTVASAGWWRAQGHRHQMWRAVTAAEHAVTVARRAGAPVGDLPTAARQLHTAARTVDALLRVSTRTRSHRAAAIRERHQVTRAAAELHRAAIESLTVVARTDVEPMLSALRLEVASLAAGVRAHSAV